MVISRNFRNVRWWSLSVFQYRWAANTDLEARHQVPGTLAAARAAGLLRFVSEARDALSLEIRVRFSVRNRS
jgi:hypothetical protein